MANAQIKITQLPNIGNNLGANTLLPVVDTTGTAITEKVTVGNVANFMLTEAGNLLPEAGVAVISYSVANAAQPNITSVGNLTGLTITNLNNFHLPGGTNGYVLQTNGNGNLNWTAQSGSGNGSPGGANSQIQFNDSGLFEGSASLTWDAGNSQLNTVNIGASSATIYGNLATVNATVTTNLTAANAEFDSTVSNTVSVTGNITANFFLGNGSALTGITATANGAGPNNSIQYNANGIFAGDANLSWDPTLNTLNTTTIQAGNITANSNITSNIVSANFLYGDGSNISNIGNVNYANTANVANLANLVVVESVNNNFSYHVVLTTGANDYSLHNDADDNFQYNPADGTLTVTRVDTDFIEAGNVISNLIPFLDVSYNIGSNTHRWNDLYLSNSTIYLGDATISANGNSIVVDSISVTNGNVGTIGNVASINLDGSNSNVLYGNGVFAPAGGSNADIGNLQITGTTIGIANGASETSISIGANSASMTVDTDSGAPVLNLQVQSTDSQYYEETFDYTSGIWAVNGLEGTLTITGYSPAFESFLNNLGQYQSFTITINGSETTATNGYSYGGGNATFYTILPPGVDPTTVNNIVFNTIFSNKLLMDPDEGDMGIYIGDFNFEIESQRDVRISTRDDFSIRANDGFEMRANADFRITTDYNNSQQNWAFLTTGNLDIPGNINFTGDPSAAPKLNNFFGVTSAVNFEITTNTSVANLGWVFDTTGNLVLAGGNSVIQSVANSSLDPINPNVSTMVLTPDANYSSQALVLDPTAPGHIHLRSLSGTGNIDEPMANLFLGGEASSFEIGASYGGAPNVYIHSNNNTWIFDDTGNITVPSSSGGLIKTVANGFVGIAAIDNGTDNPAQVLSINSNGTATTAISAYANQATIQANINGDIKTWAFDNAGNLTLPGNTVAINFANGTAAFGNIVSVNKDGNSSNILYGNGVFAAAPSSSTYGDSNVTTLLSNFGSNSISTTGNVTAGNISGNISITGNVTGTSPNVSLVAGSFTATFDNTGKLTLPSMGGDEGGEINLGIPTSNTTLSTRVVLDVYQDRLRFYDGSTKGAYIDLAQAGTGVSTLLNNRVSATNLALNTNLTFDNLAIQIRTNSSGVWIFAATVSGTATYQWTTQYLIAGGADTAVKGVNGTMSATTTPALLGAGSYFTNSAATTITSHITDTTNSKMYRVVWMTTSGSSPYGNFVTIERLV